ncbi:hypothetical protein RG47T_0371 [Mucilaginibacter polytrichastri]|uniref:Uncharacterized protein n=1 Tax=Mucilaginibacter polytrichastri TaxID=1302689 RepID=A0A1Q5ZT66_9SPHI|nr:hypothetical protein RG47T_0371 [Mucilaginibacter polytrichastri]
MGYKTKFINKMVTAYSRLIFLSNTCLFTGNTDFNELRLLKVFLLQVI